MTVQEAIQLYRVERAKRHELPSSIDTPMARKPRIPLGDGGYLILAIEPDNN